MPGLCILVLVVFLVGGPARSESSLENTADPQTENPLIQDDQPERAVLQRVDQLLADSQIPQALAFIDSVVPLARAEGDSSLVLSLLVRYGGALSGTDRSRESDPILREALSLAQALADSTAICNSLHWLSVALMAQGERSEADEHLNRMLDVAIATGDSLQEAWARLGLAWNLLEEGFAEEAAEAYGNSARLFESVESSWGSAWARYGLGNVEAKLGRYDAALGSYRRAAVAARRIDNVAIRTYVLSEILSDQGNLELSLGDPGTASTCFEQAYRLHHSSGNLRGEIVPALRAAHCQALLGQFSEAAVVLESLAEATLAENFLDLHAEVLIHSAQVQYRRGRVHESVVTYRRALAIDERLSLKNRVDALIGLSASLAELNAVAQSRSVLEKGLLAFGDSSDLELGLELRYALGQRLLTLGDNEGALFHLGYVVDEERRVGRSRLLMMALVGLARAQLEMGDEVAAFRRFEEAAIVWESARAVPIDPEWREARGAAADRVYTGLAALLLEFPIESLPIERMETAFDRLQLFKSRTLLERIAGPGLGTDYSDFEPVSFATLRTDVLRPGELFLDAFVGPGQSFLFAISRDSCRVARLPAAAELQGRLRLYHELLRTTPRLGVAPGVKFLEQAETTVAQLIFSELENLLARADRILFAPDGPLNLIPLSVFDALVRPESEIFRFPSATFLARARAVAVPRLQSSSVSDSNARQTRPSRVLAVAANWDGSLPGASREVERLVDRFRNVESIQLDGVAKVPSTSELFAEHDVVHIAAHVRIDDESPWRSMVLLSPVDSENPRADQIVAMPLAGELVVLSTCESAGGRILSGEGVQGLSSAFLGAGIPSVLATLWPVDDEATASLMESFYEQLARGETTGTALRRAQRELASNPDTRHPYYWAGFVLLGAGDTTLVLARKRPAWPLAWLSILVLGLVFGRRILERARKACDGSSTGVYL